MNAAAGRVVSLVASLHSERISNASSVRLMEHAATLDMEDFEDAEIQDQLERVRRQTSGRMTLMPQLLGQARDIVTVASFAARLVLYAPWLSFARLFSMAASRRAVDRGIDAARAEKYMKDQCDGADTSRNIAT